MDCVQAWVVDGSSLLTKLDSVIRVGVRRGVGESGVGGDTLAVSTTI